MIYKMRRFTRKVSTIIENYYTMKYAYLSLSFLLCFGFCAHGQSYKQYLKQTRKAEKYYQMGQYEKAIRENDKIAKRASKTSKAEVYKTLNSLHKAKSLEAQGKFKEMEALLKAADTQIATWKTTQPDAFLIGQWTMAEVLIAYDNPLRTTQLLERSPITNTTTLIEANLQQQNALVALQMKNFEEAERLVEALLPVRENLVTKQASKGLSKEEKKLAKAQLGALYTLKGSIYTERGDYEQADAILSKHNKRVRSLVGVTQPVYLAHLMAIGENYDGQEAYAKATDYYNMAQRANEYYDDTYRRSSKLYMRLQENIARNTILRSKSYLVQRIEFNRLRRDAKKFFGEGSIPYLRAQIIEIEQQIARKKYQEAQQALTDILAKEEVLPADHEMRAYAMELLAGLYIKNEANLTQMDKVHQEWMQVQAGRYPETSFAYKEAQIKLGHYYAEYSDAFKEATKIFDSIPFTVVQEQLSPTQKDYVLLSNYYAQYFVTIGAYKEAESLLENTLKLVTAKYDEEDERLISQLSALADVNVKLGAYKQAEFYTNRALEIIQENFPTESPAYAAGIAQMASLYGIIGNYQEAERLLRQSNEIYRKLEKDEEILAEYNLEALKSESIEQLAEIYVRIGDYSNTEQLLNEDLTLKEKKYGTQSRKLIRPVSQLAYLNLIKGNYDVAEEQVVRAEKIIVEAYGKESLFYAESQELLASIHTALGNFDRAENEINETIRLQKKILGDYHIEEAQALRNLAIIQFAEKPKENLEKAEKNLNQAIAIIKATFDDKHPQYADALKNLAALYIESGKYQDANQLLTQANAIWVDKLGENNVNTASIYSLRGDISVKTKDFSRAEENYVKARDLYKQIFNDRHPGYVKNVSKLGRVYYINENYAQANQNLDESTNIYLGYIQKYFPSLSEREKAKYWNLIKADFEFYKSLAVKQRNTKPLLMANVYDHILATKALLLNSSIKIRQRILNGNDEELKALYRDWIEQKEYLATVIEMSAEERLKNGVDVVTLELEIEALEKELSAQSGIFDTYKNYTWKDIANQLKPNEAAVEITRFRLYEQDFTDSTLYLALKVEADTSLRYPKTVILEQGNDLEKGMLAYYQNTMKFKLPNRLSYKAFWQPIEKLIGNVERVYLSPDGVFNQVNLSSININKNEYVIDRVDISLVSNTKDLVSKEETPPPTSKSAILFGNPDFYVDQVDYQKISALPGTAKELENVSEVLKRGNWSVSRFTKQTAEEEKVKTVESPTVFHIATHGFFAPDAKNTDTGADLLEAEVLQNPLLKSGLLLRGAGDIFNEEALSFNSRSGILTAYEAMNLNFDHTRLVVLSACETGLGEVQVGEGVFGLQRAFQVAGAKQIVMSLFKVDDAVTQKLMSEFYKNLLTNTDTRAAFRQAQKTIKQQYKNPIFWGAFVVIGVE